MNRLFKLISIFIICTSFFGCSTLSGLKFWGDDEEEVELPAELEEIAEKAEIKLLWSAKVGKSVKIGRIQPSISSETIFYINSEGELYALNRKTGEEIWTRATEDTASGGVISSFKKIIYGTQDGEVVVLNQGTGEEIWRSQITGEILSSPITDGSIVVAQGADGSVTGLDISTGEKNWVHQVTVPNLSLRGTSRPVLEQGFIFTGFANGTVAMIYPDSGAIRLEAPTTINEGTSELERIVDIDGRVVVANNIFVSATYQGNITAIDLQQGRPAWQEKLSTTKDLVEARSRIVAIGEKDIIKAFGLSSGVILWQQQGLKLRGLTSPVNLRGNILVGDFEGYLHLINATNGSFIGRAKISKNPLLEIVTEGDKIAVTDNKGKLFFLSSK